MAQSSPFYTRAEANPGSESVRSPVPSPSRDSQILGAGETVNAADRKILSFIQSRISFGSSFIEQVVSYCASENDIMLIEFDQTLRDVAVEGVPSSLYPDGVVLARDMTGDFSCSPLFISIMFNSFIIFISIRVLVYGFHHFQEY